MSADQSRDWDKEMAEIDKVIAKSPPAKLAAASGVAPGPPAGGAPAPVRGGGERVARGGAMGTWVRVGLGVLLAAAMTQWPYFHACGTALFLYLGAVGAVAVGGVWGMLTSWRRRIPAAHVVSIGVFLWGLALAAGVFLPRIGYARGLGTWLCP